MAHRRGYHPSIDGANTPVSASRNRAARTAALLLAVTALWALFSLPADAMRREKLTLHTAQGAHIIDTEITETLEEMQRGLMFRTHLAENAGMLFVYPQPTEVTMWMENTRIPLDMVFIRKDGTVHRIQAWTEPFSRATIGSRGEVIACLELAGGVAERLGLKPGDRIEHALFNAGKK